MEAYLGIDIGSVTTKFALLDKDDEVIKTLYLPTQGRPIEIIQHGLKRMRDQLPERTDICGVATTGSARQLAGLIVGADLVKNEITCHATAALHYLPQAQTIIEIGGQDSKIIIIRNGVVTDFGMNTVCAAGTGSFLDHQAQRLHMSIEELGQRALNSKTPVNIAGKCTVFAESDMINKQQMGHKTEDILYGLCRALARNYLSNVGLSKDIQSPVLFQGGVAFNRAMVNALQEELETEIIVPPHHEVMGAIGAALLVNEKMSKSRDSSEFHGFEISETEYHTAPFECKACPNMCEIAELRHEEKMLARWGGRCDLWEVTPATK